MGSLPEAPAPDPCWLEQDLCTVGSPVMGSTPEAAAGLSGTLCPIGVPSSDMSLAHTFAHPSELPFTSLLRVSFDAQEFWLG